MEKKEDIEIKEKIDRILLNQRAIMKNLAFGFPTLMKDEILNQSLLTGIEGTEEIFNKNLEEDKE